MTTRRRPRYRSSLEQMIREGVRAGKLREWESTAARSLRLATESSAEAEAARFAREQQATDERLRFEKIVEENAKRANAWGHQLLEDAIRARIQRAR